MMLPTFELRQKVLDNLEGLGVQVYVEGREAVEFADVPLPDGFSASTTQLRFSRGRDSFRVLVPEDLTYNGPDDACREALAARPAGRWRPLKLDRSACTSFEGALAAAFAVLGSPARAALRRASPAGGRAQPEPDDVTREAQSALVRFATALTPAIKQGRWPAIVERDEELDFIEDALVQYAPGARLVLVDGAVGSGRWSTGAIGLGQRMIDGSCRAELAGKGLYLLNPASILGGLMMIGELEERILQIATETVAGGHVLFVPDNALQVVRLLPPLHDLNVVVRVSRVELETWRIAAPNQIGKATIIKLRPLEPGSAREVLAAHQALLGEHYRLTRLDEDALDQAVTLADEFLPGVLPGSAVRLLEQACAVASRQAQHGGEGAVKNDHLLQALSRLGGEQAADDLLARWFKQAVTPPTKARKRRPDRPSTDEPIAQEED